MPLVINVGMDQGRGTMLHGPNFNEASHHKNAIQKLLINQFGR